ncbi:hypothetical protein ARMGADRAFT_13624 [Armillaria gallica]|uniref:Uncharacterized protein n=1 Tax=Armillaria gallica TaxID=47427 RepID=A0A2H3EL28_ARMGA|nr:hypothetical protein ARMGADRAFT_13624 [Armillaria gallica]
MRQELGPMFRIWNMSWETHCIRHQSLLHFPWSPIQIWPTRQIVCMNLPEHFRGSECGMRPSEAVQSWVSSRHFTGHPIFNSRRTCGNRTCTTSALWLEYTWDCEVSGSVYHWLDLDIFILVRRCSICTHLGHAYLSSVLFRTHVWRKQGAKKG